MNFEIKINPNSTAYRKITLCYLKYLFKNDKVPCCAIFIFRVTALIAALFSFLNLVLKTPNVTNPLLRFIICISLVFLYPKCMLYFIYFLRMIESILNPNMHRFVVSDEFIEIQYNNLTIKFLFENIRKYAVEDSFIILYFKVCSEVSSMKTKRMKIFIPTSDLTDDQKKYFSSKLRSTKN